MSVSQIQLLKNKAKLLQKAKKKAGKPILLKEAFAILARNAGFSSWREFKAVLESTGSLCPAGSSAHWNTW